jgi:signal transduction histidine kinase
MENNTNNKEVTKPGLAITGIGSSKRRLYTDDEDVIYSYKRLLIINGINNSLTEPDALDRSILKEFERISDDQRKEESKVEADKGRIIQVIDNLISNALKFTNEGTIYVLVESKDGQAVVSVKDNGQGIDPDILPKLFTKFASKSEIGGGTGLGLFISKSIIESHGGKIWAENNKDTKGATFSFSLPLAINNERNSSSNDSSRLS